MNARTGAAFAVTFALALPAGWWALEAGPPGVPAARPPLSTVEVGKSTVTVAVDRNQVNFGDRVAVKVSARGAAGQQPEVEVSLMERRGSELSRVQTPPRVVSSERVKLSAAPTGGAEHEVGFTLGSVPDDPIAVAGQTRTYMIVVAPAGKARPFGGVPLGAAMATVLALAPRAVAVEVTPPAHLEKGAEVTIPVRIRNLTGKKLSALNVNLWSGCCEITGKSGPDELAPHQELVLAYKARAHQDGPAADYTANVFAGYGGAAAVSVHVDGDGKQAVSDPALLALRGF
jgi:hypothetical protein